MHRPVIATQLGGRGLKVDNATMIAAPAIKPGLLAVHPQFIAAINQRAKRVVRHTNKIGTYLGKSQIDRRRCQGDTIEP